MFCLPWCPHRNGQSRGPLYAIAIASWLSAAHLQCLDASLQQLLVVELHTVSSLVLNSVPERFEVGAVQHGLAES